MLKSVFILICGYVCISGYEVKPISIPKINLATRPVWDDINQSLYFINFLSVGTKEEIYRYSLTDEKLHKAKIPKVEKIGFIYPVNRPKFKNIFAIGNGHNVSLIKWDGVSKKAKSFEPNILFSLESDNPLTGADIVAADPAGRFYVGTFSANLCKSPAKLAVYRYISGMGVEQVYGGIHGTSGLAVDQIAKKLYHLEYCTLILSQFDWDPVTGDLSDRQVAFDFKSIGKTTKNFIPVGMAIDTNGFVYTADYKHSVYIINPKLKKLVKVIDMGVQGINGLAFGGPKRDILFVTASADTVDTNTGSIQLSSRSGSSLYIVTGLHAIGEETPSFKVSEENFSEIA